MRPITSIAQSGLQAAQARLNTSAHNVANGQTEGFKRQTVQASADEGGGVKVSISQAAQAGANLEQDVVNQMAAKQDFLANLKVIKTADQMMGSLLDERA